jgi:VanZ family protein
VSTENVAVPPALRARKLWLVIGWALVLFVIYMSLTPVPVEIPVEEGDKFGHAFAYAALMVWFASLYDDRNTRLLFAIGFVSMGVALEFVQRETGYRTFELADMVADAIGVIAGWALAPPRIANCLYRAERLIYNGSAR